MPTHKEPLRYLSISQLAEVSGRSRETIRHRISRSQLQPHREDGKTVWYDAPLALEIILGGGEGLDPRVEKARLDKARADMQELQLAIKRGEVAEISAIARAWAAIVLTAKEAIRSIPAAATVHIPGFTKPMARKLAELIDATLTELADARTDGDLDGDDGAVEAAAPEDAERVG